MHVCTTRYTQYPATLLNCCCAYCVNADCVSIPTHPATQQITKSRPATTTHTKSTSVQRLTKSSNFEKSKIRPEDKFKNPRYGQRTK